MKKISFWLKNARMQALPQSVLPAIAAVCLASSFNGFSIYLGIAAIFGVILGHLGLNLFDDYFDYKRDNSEFRKRLTHEGFRARMSKCSYIASEEASVKDLLIACCAFSAIALVLGAIILYFRGITILYFAVATAIIGISYSGPPLRLSYHYLGELVIGIIFGPMIMMGCFYSACGTISPLVILTSIPIGLLVSNILYVHSIMDYEPDKKVGKHTLAVFLKNGKSMLVVQFIMIFTPFAIILAGIILERLSIYYLFIFLTLPMAISLFNLMVQFVKDPKKDFSPKFWMGPMGDWERIKKGGTDWFLIRWFLARNLLSFFTIIIIILGLFA